jgi:hypothetical protein
MQIELEETKALLLLPRVQGTIRQVLENLRADLEKQIAQMERGQEARRA